MELRRIAFVLASTLLAASADGKPLERVPEDGSLQQAIQRVDDGGVIEIAAGTYAAPNNGFRAVNLGKRFTVRAADGATVVLDGEGQNPIFLFSGKSVRDRIDFERVVFRDGVSTDPSRGAGVTVEGGRAFFTSCVFEHNELIIEQGGGGGLRVTDGAFVRVVNSRFEDNIAGQRGGGMYVLESTATIVWSQFLHNRAVLPDHDIHSVGGALYTLDSEVDVSFSRFQGNDAGLAGGAIFTFALASSANRLTLESCVLEDNVAEPDPTVVLDMPISGGALHAEAAVGGDNQVVVRSSRVLRNRANWGGGLSAFQAALTVIDSVLADNETYFPDRPELVRVTPAGGDLIFFPGGNDVGLEVRNTLLQGLSGKAGPAATAGGCLFASGDAQIDARVVIVESVFFDCDVATSDQGNGFGAALYVNQAQLDVGASLFLGNDTTGSNASGGGIFGLRSQGTIADSTFAANSADVRGGGLFWSGGEIFVSSSRFFDNVVSPGVNEPVTQSGGAALALSPDFSSGFDLVGSVTSSLFKDNDGLDILELDTSAGPFSQVTFTDNRFGPNAYGGVVFRNTFVGGGGSTPGQLNGLNVAHGSQPPIDKGSGNQSVAASTPGGQAVAAPHLILPVTTPGDDGSPPAGAQVFWYFSGSTASLGGQALPEAAGVREVFTPGIQTLRVNGQQVDSAEVEQGACNGGPTLCLGDSRFLVNIDWRDVQDQAGNGQAVVAGSNDSGLMWFFSPDNWEILVKVLDGCSINDKYWVFAAATTDVEYTLTVTDTQTGSARSYLNRLGQAAPAVTDTEAFAVCDGKSTDRSPSLRELAAEIAEFEGFAAKADCASTDTALCLAGKRFQVEVDWQTSQRSGKGHVVPLSSADSGLFWFFTEDNWEMLVKVLRGCSINQRFWVLAAATTNVGYTLTITDTEKNQSKSYVNPVGKASPAILDTSALATCP